MKIAPLHKVFEKESNVESILVHTGQHHEINMSNIFFRDLDLPTPKYFLGVNERNPIQRLSNMMLKLNPIIEKEKPDLMIVVGDVDSTLAGALVANKMKIKLAHIEAGLRSFDNSMPEEINRVLTDKLSDYLFLTEESGVENLKREGINSEKVNFVGNVMIDSLKENLEKIEKLDLKTDLGVEVMEYALMTMHRPSNVDSKEQLEQIIKVIETVTKHISVVFPLHPRTGNNLKKYGLMSKFLKNNKLKVIKPQGYNSFVKLMKESKVVITDSGGIQEETTFLKIPCVTLRSSTERPCTVEVGTNTIIPNLEVSQVEKTLLFILNNEYKKGSIPLYWDGNSAKRIADILLKNK